MNNNILINIGGYSCFFFSIRLFAKTQTAFDLYRSIVCFMLTNIGCMFCIYNYEKYYCISIYDESESNTIWKYDWSSTQLYFSSFLMTDLLLMTVYKNWRKDLIFHHLFSLFSTFFFWNKLYIIHLSMLLESYSMFNSITIFLPFEIVKKMLCMWRIWSILSIRLGVYTYASIVFYQYNKYEYIMFPSIFVCLDTFWLYKNFQKYNRIK